VPRPSARSIRGGAGARHGRARSGFHATLEPQRAGPPAIVLSPETSYVLAQERGHDPDSQRACVSTACLHKYGCTTLNSTLFWMLLLLAMLRPGGARACEMTSLPYRFAGPTPRTARAGEVITPGGARPGAPGANLRAYPRAVAGWCTQVAQVPDCDTLRNAACGDKSLCRTPR
jgi:hypothetical protein